ncbi:hypothetical protein [Haladaptatus sp. GCM10025893]|uniref:hypothetical protein n=1 Tax=Haladaptatus sp. GCM10025893 TaxID=3252659 RepID=UPI00360A3A63
MSLKIVIERRENLPVDATVCDYDQLSEAEQRVLPRLLEGEARGTDLAPKLIGDLEEREFVKFTAFYRIRVVEPGVTATHRVPDAPQQSA